MPNHISRFRRCLTNDSDKEGAKPSTRLEDAKPNQQIQKLLNQIT
jgi:hypothetical protein